MALSQAELKAIASLDTSQFEAGSKRVKDSTDKMSDGMKGMIGLGKMIGAAFAIGAIASYGKSLMQEAAANERFSKSVGISAGMLDELGDKAAETGASAEGFRSKIVKLIEAQEKAVSGDKNMIETFKRLGISMTDLTSKTPEQLLLAVAKGAQHSASAVMDLNAAMGKGAAGEYGAVLKDIAENGMPKVSKEAAAAADRFARMNAQLEIMKDKTGHFAMEAVSNVGPVKGTLAGIGAGALMGGKVGSVFGPYGTAIGAAAGGIGLGIGGFFAGRENEKAQAESAKRVAENKSTEAAARLTELKARHDALISAAQLERSEKSKDVMDKRKKAIENITVAAPTAADSMAAYGRIVGTQYQGNGGTAERQLKELEIIAESTKEMTKIQDETNKKIEALGGE